MRVPSTCSRWDHASPRKDSSRCSPRRSRRGALFQKTALASICRRRQARLSAAVCSSGLSLPRKYGPSLFTPRRALAPCGGLIVLEFWSSLTAMQPWRVRWIRLLGRAFAERTTLHRMNRRCIARAAAVFLATGLHAANAPLTPRLVGDWWTVAGHAERLRAHPKVKLVAVQRMAAAGPQGTRPAREFVPDDAGRSRFEREGPVALRPTGIGRSHGNRAFPRRP